MPWGDRTGPAGMGPMTGRAAGLCAGYGVPGYMNPIPGRGFGIGFGRGRGFGGGGRGFGRGGHGFGGGGRGWGGWAYGAGWPGQVPFSGWGLGVPQTPTADAESQFLKQEAKVLRSQLDTINKRLDELTAEKAPES